MEQTNARYVLQTTYVTSPGYIDNLVSLLGDNMSIDKVPGVERVAYRLDDGLQVVELVGFDSIEAACRLLETKTA